MVDAGESHSGHTAVLATREIVALLTLLLAAR
jgi:hypothetical protein